MTTASLSDNLLILTVYTYYNSAQSLVSVKINKRCTVFPHLIIRDGARIG